MRSATLTSSAMTSAAATAALNECRNILQGPSSASVCPGERCSEPCRASTESDGQNERERVSCSLRSVRSACIALCGVVSVALNWRAHSYTLFGKECTMVRPCSHLTSAL
eukprot:4234735-Pleurochrysis_carterae.AAC.1